MSSSKSHPICSFDGSRFSEHWFPLYRAPSWSTVDAEVPDLDAWETFACSAIAGGKPSMGTTHRRDLGAGIGEQSPRDSQQQEDPCKRLFHCGNLVVCMYGGH